MQCLVICRNRLQSTLSSKWKEHLPGSPTTIDFTPYHLSKSNLKQIELVTKAQLSLKYGQKNVILAAAHPGSNRLMAELSQFVAHRLGADYLSLDYQSIVATVSELKQEQIIVEEFFNLDKKIPISEVFTPGQYQILEEDDDADDENEYDDEEDENDDFRIGNNVGKFNGNEIKFSSPATLFMNLTMAARDHKKGLADEEQNQNHNLVISNISMKRDDESKTTSSSSNQTPFDLKIPASDIKKFLSHLYQQIKTRDRKTIIYLNDLTDIIQGHNLGSGEKLLIGLCQTIKELRNLGFPVLLVAGSCPSITETKNLNQDVHFYSQVLDGNFYVSGPRGRRNYIALEGSIFNSTLDNMSSEFDKVCILPPSFVFLALQKKLDPTKPKSLLLRDAPTYQRSLRVTLEQLEFDLKNRIFELNRNSFISACGSLNFRLQQDVKELLNKGISGVGRKNISVLTELLGSLSTNVWALKDIINLAQLSAGFADEKENDLEINVDNFLDALIVIHETDYKRYSMMSPEQIDERMNAIPTPIKLGGDKEGESDPTTQEAKNAKSRKDTLEADFKRRGIKLNQYEKKLLSSIINPAHIAVTLPQLILPPKTKLVLQTLVTLPMLKPELFATGVLSRSAIHGVLLFGPPGTGKTMLAKAISKSSGAYFMNISLADIFDKYVGEGEKNMQAVFSLARKLGKPCVIFFDEVDSLFGSRRSDSGGSTRREIINVCMAEWDGLGSKNDGILVLGATNRPFDLDDAILRRMPRRVLSIFT